MNLTSLLRRSRHWFRPRILLAFGLLPTLALVYTAREPLLVGAARILTVDDAEAPADYLVVLGGGAETRPFEAAALYRRGFAPKVLVFEHKTDRLTELGLTPPHDDLYRKVLELKGVRPGAVERVPGVVDSSWDEARVLREYLASHPARRVILVTSAEHTRRARWVFRKVLAPVRVDVRMAPARHVRFDETNWWNTDEGALAYIHEYLKLPAYWLMSALRLDPHARRALEE